MKYSYAWIKEYLDLKLSAEEAAGRLTMAGLEVVGSEKVRGDWVGEVEVTPNRPDWLSMLGIARELGAVLNLKLKLPIPPAADFKKDKNAPVTISIETKDCTLYIGYVIEGVTVGPSPGWLSRRLESLGVRSINNIVDITNFVLLETGQPLHAFDLDKITGQTIRVINAKKGQHITTLDGVDRALHGGEVLIADGAGPVALAGVMGGTSTEVDSGTKRILLESALFSPVATRRTSRTHTLSTESSLRFERKVPASGVLYGARRAALMIEELASGCITAKTYDGSVKAAQKKNVVLLNPANVTRWLGTGLGAGPITAILKRLGFSIAPSAGKLKVTVPQHRLDITGEVDLIEEIARLVGFENIEEEMPRWASGAEEAKTSGRRTIEKAKNILAANGLTEALTYSLVSEELLRTFGVYDEAEAVHLENPLSQEQALMRRRILPGLLGSLSRNATRHNRPVKLFELSNVYIQNKGRIAEYPSLALAIDETELLGWKGRGAPVDFFDLKGILQALCEGLGATGLAYRALDETGETIFSPGASAQILLDGTAIGVMGLIKEKVQKALDIEKKVYAAELSFEALIRNAATKKKMYTPLPRFPEVRRDISLIAPEELPQGEITAAISALKVPHIQEVILFDVYTGKHIPEGKRGLTYAVVYRSDERTLTDEEVNGLHQRIVDHLTDKLQLTVRQ